MKMKRLRKFRIIEDSRWEFMVQCKHPLRPFWINNEWMTDFWNYDIWHNTFEEAEEELNNLIERHNYRECVKIKKEIYFKS